MTTRERLDRAIQDLGLFDFNYEQQRREMLERVRVLAREAQIEDAAKLAAAAHQQTEPTKTAAE